MQTQRNQREGYSRRDFIKASTAATIGLSAGLMTRANFAFAAPNETIKVGVVGTGGRGTGAARDAVSAAEGVVIWAMGDLFPDRLQRSRNELAAEIPDKLQVTDDRAFSGWDAYKQVIDSGVDYVILATPPGFRPMHLRYAVEQGKHVFMEKPVAVDPVGVRSVMESADLAKTKGLGIVAGTQRRHDPAYVATIQRIHDGALGEIVAGQVYWNQGALWKVDRTPEMSDMEWQVRNWLYFTWLSGDHIVEQHVHNIDVANWVLGTHPISANGVGGRQVRVDPVYGHIYDHFSIELEYPNGARIQSMCRQQDNTARFVGEHFMGTKGTTNANSWIRGENTWRYDAEPVNPYVQEHTDLIASIRAGSPLNEGHQIAESVLTAIMAREAAYTGQVVTWDEILNASLDLTPETFAFGPMPVPPVPMPGVTQLARTAFAHGM